MSTAPTAGCVVVHGVDHDHGVVPVHERGHDHGVDHGHDTFRHARTVTGFDIPGNAIRGLQSHPPMPSSIIVHPHDREKSLEEQGENESGALERHSGRRHSGSPKAEGRNRCRANAAYVAWRSRPAPELAAQSIDDPKLVARTQQRPDSRPCERSLAKTACCGARAVNAVPIATHRRSPYHRCSRPPPGRLSWIQNTGAAPEPAQSCRSRIHDLIDTKTSSAGKLAATRSARRACVARTRLEGRDANRGTPTLASSPGARRSRRAATPRALSP